MLGGDPDVADDAPRVVSEIFLAWARLVAPTAIVAAQKYFLNGGASTSGAMYLSWPGQFGLGVLVLCASFFALAL